MITQFICNLLTSCNNHLLLQFCRWLALALEQAPARVAMMVIYHHHRPLLRMSFLHSYWEIREQWRIHCASMHRTPLMPVSNIKGLNLINIAHSKISKTLSLLSSKRPKNRSRRMVAKHNRAKVLYVEGNGSSEGRVCISSTVGTDRDMVDSFPILSTCQRTGHLGTVQVSL